MLLPICFTIFAIIHKSSSIEYKYKTAKPDEFRCAYKEVLEEGKDGMTEKWRLKPSATACEDELPAWIPLTKLDGKMRQKTLCEEIFVKNVDDAQELRPKMCNNEC
jgi:hypothetical protein